MCVTTNAITPAYIANSNGITTNKLQPAKRRISFATVISQVVVVPSRHEFTVSEKESYWWTCRDQEHSRHQIERDIAAVRRYGLFGNIENSYETACKLAVDVGMINIVLLKDSNLQSPDLHKWTSNGVGRGLETYISNYHGDQREDDSRHARTMVFFTQRKGVSSAQEISDIYAESSRPSLIYSRMMGDADSMCVSK